MSTLSPFPVLHHFARRQLWVWLVVWLPSLVAHAQIAATPADNIRLVGGTAGVDRARLTWDGFNTDGAALIIQDAALSDVLPVVANGDTLRGDLTYGLGDTLAPNMYVLAAGYSVRKASIQGLEPSHRYRLDVVAYNGQYQYTAIAGRTGGTFYFTTPAKTYPVGLVRDSLIAPILGPDCASIAVNWQGDPAHQSLLVIQDVSESDYTPLPVDGTYYTPNPFFSVGQAIGPGQYVVASTLGKASQILQLKPSHRYRLDVIAYTDDYQYANSYYTSTPGATYYFTTTNCPPTPPPTVGARVKPVQYIDCSTVRLSCSPGNGEGRLFVIRYAVGAAPIFTNQFNPDQGSVYPPSNLFSQGLPVGPAGGGSDPFAWSVALGKDSSVVVYGLPTHQNFNFSVYEYKTQLGFVLGLDSVTHAPIVTYGPTGNNPGYAARTAANTHPLFDMPLCPGDEPNGAVPARRARFSHLTQTTVRLHWQNGDGTGRAVVLRSADATSPRLLLPRQRVVYRPNGYLPLADTTRRDSYVVATRFNPERPFFTPFVYRDDSVEVSGLQPHTLYQMEVFESGDWPTSPVYLLSQPGARTLFITESAPVTPLPVTLVAFTVHAQPGGDVLANWTTATEKNSAYFQLEYATDGRNFLPAGSPVAAAGTTTAPRRYSTTHSAGSSAPRLLYYRLRQVDLDGKTAYSPVRSLSRAAGVQQLVAYPNPTDAAERVTVQLTGSPAQTEPVLLTVRALLGNAVLERSLPAGEVIETSFSTHDWAPGVYLLDALTAAGHCHARLLVR